LDDYYENSRKKNKKDNYVLNILFEIVVAQFSYIVVRFLYFTPKCSDPTLVPIHYSGKERECFQTRCKENPNKGDEKNNP